MEVRAGVGVVSIAVAPWRRAQVARVGAASTALGTAYQVGATVALYGTIAVGAYGGYRLAGGGAVGVAAGVVGAVVAPVGVAVVLYLVGAGITGKS